MVTSCASCDDPDQIDLAPHRREHERLGSKRRPDHKDGHIATAVDRAREGLDKGDSRLLEVVELTTGQVEVARSLHAQQCCKIPCSNRSRSESPDLLLLRQVERFEQR
jgi:hypothetical protein